MTSFPFPIASPAPRARRLTVSPSA